MVIKFDELKKLQFEELKPHLVTLEKKIDNLILKSRSGKLSISGHIFSEVYGLPLDHLLDKYKSAGWDVKYVNDQRDGDFYQFKEDVKNSDYLDHPIRSNY